MTTTVQRLVTLTAFIGAALSSAPRVGAQQDITMRRIFSSDSMTIPMAQVSPDGRWLVMRVTTDGGSSLWMASTSGGAPFRLTSQGFDDRFPVWFSSGDRIAFSSTRFNRDGSREVFLAVQAIDPATGRAVGVPRQISSEPVTAHSRPSPDGRWVPYVTAAAPQQIRIVPANGGAVRTLARLDRPVALSGFGADSEYVYYQETSGAPGVLRYTLKRVAIAGGAAPEVVTEADHPVRRFSPDARYVLHEVASDPFRYELRTLRGEIAGAISLPRGMRSPTFSGDGWGIMGLEFNRTNSVRVVSVDGGESKVLVEGGSHWPEAWMPDGSAIITDRPDGNAVVFETISMSGEKSRSVRLPTGTSQSGWQSSVGPWMSYRVPAPSGNTEALYAVNVNTGERHEISRSAVRVGFRGRGGYEQDGNRWIYVSRTGESGGLELRSADPATGASARIVGLPSELRFGQGITLSVHGSRVAYTQARGDSVDLFVIDGPAAQPRKIASFSKDGDTVTWSWDGSMIAVADWLPGTPRRGGVHLITMGSDASSKPRIRLFDLGVENGCDSFTWTPDDSHIVMLCYRANARIMKLRVSDGQLSPVLTGDQPQQIWEYYLSPDGRKVAYTIQRNAGVSVSVASFRSLIESRKGP